MCISRGMCECISISCTFATNNACRHLARSDGYRGVAVHMRMNIHIVTARTFTCVHVLHVYSAINTPNRFVNLAGRWIGGKRKSEEASSSPLGLARTGEWH